MFPIETFGSQIALIDGDCGECYTYSKLSSWQKQLAELLSGPKSLFFLFCENRPEDLLVYITAMNLGHVVCLLDARLHDPIKNELIQLYRPAYIADVKRKERAAYEFLPFPSLFIQKRSHPDRTPRLHPSLSLLLTTSGTTGSPKLIRLSQENVLSNAKSIMQYLNIESHEKAIASLPMHYSYGLSVIHTHLLAGASIVLTQRSVLQREFWEIIQKYGCTSFAGVPYTYSMLDRIGFDSGNFPQLKTMTQAGGHLEKRLVEKFHAMLTATGGKFFVMYGQTEATARIAYVPPEMLPAKSEAIGIAIPHGRLTIHEGELIYEGPNVMLGYAEGPEDLAQGDLLHGVLHTGDLGYCDEEAIFYVTGRLKRISKVYGYRINLDEIEKMLRPYGQVAVVSDDNKIYLYFEEKNKIPWEPCIQFLSEALKLHYSTFECKTIEQFPRTTSGKIDYKRLK